MFFGKLPGKIMGFTLISILLIVLGYLFKSTYTCGFFVGVVTTLTYYGIFKEEDNNGTNI